MVKPFYAKLLGERAKDLPMKSLSRFSGQMIPRNHLKISKVGYPSRPENAWVTEVIPRINGVITLITARATLSDLYVFGWLSQYGGVFFRSTLGDWGKPSLSVPVFQALLVWSRLDKLWIYPRTQKQWQVKI